MYTAGVDWWIPRKAVFLPSLLFYNTMEACFQLSPQYPGMKFIVTSGGISDALANSGGFIALQDSVVLVSLSTTSNGHLLKRTLRQKRIRKVGSR